MAKASVDAYLADLPQDQRSALQRLRTLIRRIAPNADESIAYAMPAYKYKGKPLVYFGAAKGHVALYGNNARFLVPSDLEGLDASKGTIRFQPDNPLPEEVVETILRSRMAEIDRESR